MSELEINLDVVNLVTLWGSQNENFEFIKKAFPKLRLVARGSTLKVLGEEGERTRFQQVFDDILAHINQFQTLSLLELKVC